jgi:protein tyrosine/serine phosphatase
MKSIARQSMLKAAQASLLVLFGIIAVAPARGQQPEKFSNIRIKNFGQMDARFYRGAQPKPEDYAQLAALGIKTIVDLRDDPVSYEKSAAEAAGMRYVNIPMNDKSLPSDEQTQTFLKLVNNPATGAFFVHCAGGRHRTGVMGAVYRYNFYNWNYDQTYKEMKTYDFYTRWGHGSLKDYVEDYYNRIQTHQITVMSGGASSSVNQ